MWEKHRFTIMVTLTVATFLGFTVPNVYQLFNKPTAQLEFPTIEDFPEVESVPEKPVTMAPRPITGEGPAVGQSPIPHTWNIRPPTSGTPPPPPAKTGKVSPDDVGLDAAPRPKIKVTKPVKIVEKTKRLDEEEWYLRLKAVTSLLADIISSLFPVMTAFFSVKIWFRQRKEKRLANAR
jgi:hypothetical protein